MNKLNLVSRLRDFANVYGESKKITHGHMGVWDKYPCANPEGPVDNSDCGEDDPLCNCPCPELKPNSEEELDRINGEIHGVNEDGTAIAWSIAPDDMKEPTDEEIEQAEQSIKECEYIKEAFDDGEDWLGCLWDDIKHPSSCNCPCVGKRFGDYLDYTRTYSTYWNTDAKQPLLRNAQMQLITSQHAQMIIHGDLSLRPGTMVYINEPFENNPGVQKRIGGRWLVSGIKHTIGAFPIAHAMTVSLHRDTAIFDPNDASEEETNVWEFIQSLM